MVWCYSQPVSWPPPFVSYQRRRWLASSYVLCTTCSIFRRTLYYGAPEVSFKMDLWLSFSFSFFFFLSFLVRSTYTRCNQRDINDDTPHKGATALAYGRPPEGAFAVHLFSKSSRETIMLERVLGGIYCSDRTVPVSVDICRFIPSSRAHLHFRNRSGGIGLDARRWSILFRDTLVGYDSVAVNWRKFILNLSIKIKVNYYQTEIII